MEGNKKSKLAVFIHQTIRIIYCVYIVFLAMNVLVVLTAIIAPEAPLSRHSTSTTMFELSPLDSSRVYTASSSDPAAQVEMELFGYLKIRSGNRVYNFLFLLGYLLWQGFYLVVLNQLRLLFSTITEGVPFVNDNIRRIRLMGFCLIGGEVVRIILQYIWVNYIKGTLSVPGARLSHLNFGFYLDWLNLEIIFAGFVILVIAEVFKVGINLRQEQELTI